MVSIATVPLAVMPEGVEHNGTTKKIRGITVVPLAVMPEGVEHPAAPEGVGYKDGSPSP